MNISNLPHSSDTPFLAACLLSCALALSPLSPAQAAEPGDAAEISRGGKLYDNHWLVTGTPPPEQPNPLFPADVKTTAANTWRCVSCHGWDYAGKDGELGALSTSGAFRSLRPSAGKPPKDLIARMQAPGHTDNMQGLTEGQIDTLAHFVSSGQFNFSSMIVDGKPVGEPLLGKDIFEGACVSCHQADGKAYFQGEDGDRSSLGWVAHNRPAQAVHKIINGVPSADMLSLRFLPEKRLADLLAYLQTLDDRGDQ